MQPYTERYSPGEKIEFCSLVLNFDLYGIYLYLIFIMRI